MLLLLLLLLLCCPSDIDAIIYAEKKTIQTKDGDSISYEEFYGSRSKLIIDEIGSVFTEYYGFTNEELDFIVNYDIKYRMGRDTNDEE